MDRAFSSWRYVQSAFYMLLVAMPAFALSGCFAGGVQRPEAARYDLFIAPPQSQSQLPPQSVDKPADGRDGLSLQLASIESPAWLNAPLMQYRLVYEAPGQRQAFVDSRWVAPPAALLEQLMRHQAAFGLSPNPQSCQLQLGLEEFMQEFSAPDSSRILIEVRASLLGAQARGRPLLAQRIFYKTQMAGADAASGVAAFARSTRDLIAEMEHWLAGLQQASPALSASCRGHAS